MCVCVTQIMFHILIYCSLDKLTRGPVHVHCEDRAFITQLGIPLAQRSMFGNATESIRLQITPTGLMDALSVRGFVLRACSNVNQGGGRTTFEKNYILWTMSK